MPRGKTSPWWLPANFYSNAPWRRARALALRRDGDLCRRCNDHATHVHHIIALGAHNIDNHQIAYGLDNLESLCFECHENEHGRRKAKECESKALEFGADGEVVERVDTMDDLLDGLIV